MDTPSNTQALIDLTLVEGFLILVAVLAGTALGFLLAWVSTGRTIGKAQLEARAIEERAATAAEAKSRAAEADCDRRLGERRVSAEREAAQIQSAAREAQVRVDRMQESLQSNLDRLTQRERRQDERESELTKARAQVDSTSARLEAEHAGVRAQLEKIAGMSEIEAKAALMEEVRHTAAHEAAQESQRIIASAQTAAREKAREVTLMAIQRYAAETVSDSTVRTVKIPSEDVKGRIIGREGRNIRTIEKATGADILIDDTPGVIAVSCFDRVRQAIATETLQRLVTDGRVHPSRIEEVVAQVRRDIEEDILRHGEQAAIEANIRGLSPKLIEAMGRMHYRTSYGQNMLRHSIEVAYLCQVIADQLGLDGAIARRCGFLHDIGKALDHEVEGPHPAIGMDFARRNGERSEAVLNAIGGHHSDIPSTTPYTPIVMAADAVSGARPGARRESMDQYVKRLEQLEAIAKEQPAVQEAYAIQAGREVRVILNAGKTDDAMAFQIARDIAARVEAEMTFPGEIKVTVLREVRAEAAAR